MSRPFWTLSLGIIWLVAGTRPAAAQLNPSTEYDARRSTEAQDIRVRDSKRQLTRLSKKLQLKSDQDVRVRAILSERDRQIGLIQGSAGLAVPAKAARIRTIVVDSNVLIENVLDGRQKQKFEQVLARQRKRSDRNRLAKFDAALHILPSA